MSDESERDAEERRRLTREQYAVTRLKATEPRFTGAYLEHKEQGTYTCICCGNALFGSDSKYDSGSGWPSFRSAAAAESVRMKLDSSLGMRREEVICARCDAHLGHVFDDGPQPTGRRFCINSAALDFTPGDEAD